MAETAPVLNQKDAAELAAFRANAERDKRIEADMARRRTICNGAIPDAMLREIATASIAHDERHAAEEAAEEAAKSSAKK